MMEKTAGAAGNQRGGLRADHPGERRVYAGPGRTRWASCWTEIQIASPYITREAAALTAALSYCDDARKNGQQPSRSFRSGWTSWRWRRRSGRRSGRTWSKTAPPPRPGRGWRPWSGRNNCPAGDRRPRTAELRLAEWLTALEEENARPARKQARKGRPAGVPCAEQLELLREENGSACARRQWPSPGAGRAWWRSWKSWRRTTPP